MARLVGRELAVTGLHTASITREGLVKFLTAIEENPLLPIPAGPQSRKFNLLLLDRCLSDSMEESAAALNFRVQKILGSKSLQVRLATTFDDTLQTSLPYGGSSMPLQLDVDFDTTPVNAPFALGIYNQEGYLIMRAGFYAADDNLVIAHMQGSQGTGIRKIRMAHLLVDLCETIASDIKLSGTIVPSVNRLKVPFLVNSDNIHLRQRLEKLFDQTAQDLNYIVASNSNQLGYYRKCLLAQR